MENRFSLAVLEIAIVSQSHSCHLLSFIMLLY